MEFDFDVGFTETRPEHTRRKSWTSRRAGRLFDFNVQHYFDKCLEATHYETEIHIAVVELSAVVCSLS
jgi:hypothetical protein